MTQTRHDIPAFPIARAPGCPLDPAPELDRLRAEEPVTRVRLWDGSTPWLLTRHDDQRAMLTDPRFSADGRRPGYPHVAEGAAARTPDASFLQMDGAEHARLRKMVTADFSIRRMAALRPRVQQIADDLIDTMLAAGPSADLVEAFGLPMPSAVICELLGVPYADHEFFQVNSRVLVSRGSTREEVVEANRKLIAYLGDLVDSQAGKPGEGMLARLTAEQYDTSELTREDLAKLALLLLAGGHETSANMISLGTVALLRNPDQLAALRDTEDPRLIAGAVEELLRYLTITHNCRRRVAIEDVEIGGQLIRAGEGVIAANDAANRDETVFPDPGRLDLHRDARRHLAFGFGVHQCLGQPLVRVELQVVFGTLFHRIPTLALAVEPDQIAYKRDGLIYGVTELPVTW
jgi:cytochrome P450